MDKNEDVTTIDKNEMRSNLLSFFTGARGPASVAVVLSFVGIAIIFIGVSFSNGGNKTFLLLFAIGIGVYVITLGVKIYYSCLAAPDVIPEKDRKFLEEIIKSNGKEGIDVYIRL